MAGKGPGALVHARSYCDGSGRFGAADRHSEGESTVSKRLYVGNLSYQTTEGDLTALFQEAGSVQSVSIVTDRDTGRSKGFAFVEMSDSDAARAVEQFNGKELNGRNLNVNEARPREERSGGRGGYGGGYGGGGRRG
ncbi:hypothetical protein GCM10010219_17930 [Streptomyces netropsis]|nr:hypothetical protein GCM10010219_17930 [Streptomyces netropsis]